ncbi:MAG: DNA-3-methyladenine glycosylase [Chloroflexi bacterium]|nr:DNA-3-methyladenine glycosylase [Chloroflexota bacterium]
MADMDRLSRDFFDRNTVIVAKELLGKRLVRVEDGNRLAGYIVETEAYRGEEDLGCHARAGLTQRTSIMYGSPGHAYVYFTYGMHWMLNFVTEPKGFPAAVLIRGILPCEGMDIISNRRKGQPFPRWADGPAKLCQALNITGSLNGTDLCAPNSALFIENGLPQDKISNNHVKVSSRIGLFSVPEPWKSIPWRFVLQMEVNNEPAGR